MAASHLLGKGQSKPKAKTVRLGRKGISFKITKPGAFRRKAQAAGMSTREAAQKWKSAPGVKGSQARSAIGLLHMKKG